jgi:hypothetical protein
MLLRLKMGEIYWSRCDKTKLKPPVPRRSRKMLVAAKPRAGRKRTAATQFNRLKRCAAAVQAAADGIRVEFRSVS